MNRLNFLVVGVWLFLSACVASQSVALSADDVAAIQAAETFVVRHGFTSIPHPKDQPVEDVGLFDILTATPDELLQQRYNTLEPKAYGFNKAADSYNVFFKTVADPSGIVAIKVTRGEATRVLHSLPRNYKKGWRSVPPNKSLQRSGDP